MENRNKSDGQSGFTLIEVLIATVVLAAGLLSIAQAFTQGMLILANTPVQLAAKELAFEIIDNYVVLHDAEIPCAGINDGVETRDGRSFHVDATIDDFTNLSTCDLNQVTITVTYCTSCGGAVPDPDASNARKYTIAVTFEDP